MSSAAEVALAEILKSADVAVPSAANARIVGDDPVIPTRYRIGAAGSAVIAAAGLAAASIWEMRTGRRQEGEVDVRAAVASFRSFRYMKLDGYRPARSDGSAVGLLPGKRRALGLRPLQFPEPSRSQPCSARCRGPEKGRRGSRRCEIGGKSAGRRVYDVGRMRRFRPHDGGMGSTSAELRQWHHYRWW